MFAYISDREAWEGGEVVIEDCFKQGGFGGESLGWVEVADRVGGWWQVAGIVDVMHYRVSYDAGWFHEWNAPDAFYVLAPLENAWTFANDSDVFAVMNYGAFVAFVKNGMYFLCTKVLML